MIPAARRSWSLGSLAWLAPGLSLRLCGASLLIWLDRVNTLRETESTLLRLVQVLGEQTGRTMQTVDLMLTGLGESYAGADLAEHDPVSRTGCGSS